MVDYMITAQAEVLYEKAYGILAKYTKYTSNKKNDYPRCLDDMAISIAELAKKLFYQNLNRI